MSESHSVWSIAENFCNPLERGRCEVSVAAFGAHLSGEAWSLTRSQKRGRRQA